MEGNTDHNNRIDWTEHYKSIEEITEMLKTFNLDSTDREKFIIFNFECPICKKSEDIPLEKSYIDLEKELTTISIGENLVCEHVFQAFIDKNFKIRGYQKVDLRLETPNNSKQTNNVQTEEKNGEISINNSLSDNNLVSSQPISNETNQEHYKKEMTLEDIYEEFWEFIDDDNLEFQEFITKDERRKSHQ